MRTLKLTLEYDGTDYVGWQRQAQGISIQGLLEAALERIEGRPVPVAGAGRTDAGVHALGQVASVRLSSRLEVAVLRRALNAMLPADVRVLLIEEAADDFHARYSAYAKTYHYRIHNAELVSPFERRYVWHVPQRLDVARMMEAAALFEGTRDFVAFQAAGSPVATTERTVCASRMDVRDEDRLLVYAIAGSGFLRHMVRNIVGTLVEVGRGRRAPASVADTLNAGDRQAAGPTAPARGLFLAHVDYGEPGAELEARRERAVH